MENPINDRPLTSIELRKQLLITRGAMYRSGILTSKEKVISSLQVESLARGAIKQIGLAALTAWRGGSGLGLANMPMLLTMLAGGVSTLWRQPILKPLVRGAMVTAAVVSAVTFFVKRRKNRSLRKLK